MNERLKDDRFFFFVAASVAAHIFIFIIFTVKTVLFPSTDVQIRSAIRVDVVDLPDKIEAPPAAPPEPPPKAAVEPPPPKAEVAPPKKVVVEKSVQTKQKKALEKLSALTALERLRQEVDQQKKAEAAKPKPVEFKGNIVNLGTSLTGLERIQFDEYFQQLQEKVKAHWDLPQWLADANLKAQALVVIDERGGVIRRQIITTSANEIFDNLVLKAVDQSSPYPPPPSRLQGLISTHGVVFNFP